MKVAICTIAKLENHYIDEWVKFHLNLGFDHIFIYDNNDKNSENISDVITDEKVTIIDVQGIHLIENQTVQYWAYKKCYLENSDKFDYILFMDVDEFLILDCPSVCDFLSSEHFKGFDQIRLFIRNATDNNLIRVENNNYLVLPRFTEFVETQYSSAFIKTGLDIKVLCPHGSPDENLKNCNAHGEYVKNSERFCVLNCKRFFDTAYCNHYPTKTIEEYVTIKLHRGYPDGQTNLPSLDNFFRLNKKTPEKIEYLKSLGINYE